MKITGSFNEACLPNFVGKGGAVERREKIVNRGGFKTRSEQERSCRKTSIM